jgi:hypothetical protein
VRFNAENLIVVGAEINLNLYTAKQNDYLPRVVTERDEVCFLSWRTFKLRKLGCNSPY